MDKNQVICAECGLDGWDDKCAECGGGPGLQLGLPGYDDAVEKRVARMQLASEERYKEAMKKRAARMKGAAPRSPSMDTGQPSTSSPAMDTGQPSTSSPAMGSGRDTLSTVLSHLRGRGDADFTGSTLAASLGNFFVVLGWVVVAASLIGGIALMAATDNRDEHPYVGAGAIILASGSIQGFVLVMIGSFVQATLEFQSLVGGFFKRFKTLSL